MRRIYDVIFYFMYLCAKNSNDRLYSSGASDLYNSVEAFFMMFIATFVNAVTIISIIDTLLYDEFKRFMYHAIVVVVIFNAFMIFHKKHYIVVINRYKNADKIKVIRIYLYFLLYVIFTIALGVVACQIS